MGLLPQRLLLAVGLVALAALLVEIVLTVAATTHGSQPARVVRVDAGPYPLRVSLYTDPARAGFAVPFAIAPVGQPEGGLTYAVTSQPGPGVDATSIDDGVSADSGVGALAYLSYVMTPGPRPSNRPRSSWPTAHATST